MTTKVAPLAPVSRYIAAIVYKKCRKTRKNAEKAAPPR